MKILTLLVAKMHGLSSFRLISKLCHPRPITFSSLLLQYPVDIENYLRRQRRKRLTELMARHLVEVEAKYAIGGDSEAKDGNLEDFFED